MIGGMGATQDGILIAVEGIDGAGKTTQVERLRAALAAAGETVVASKEPTSGKWGQRIRESAQHGRMALDQELHAFTEDRREHIAKIKPALDRGDIVLLDRYFYSTIAYQGARGADPVKIGNAMRAEFPIPDLVLLIDLHPAEALERISVSRGETPNHFERLDSLQAIRQRFLDIAKDDPTIQQINGSDGIEAVYQAAMHIVLNGVLKAKRCAKSYDCDVFYCSYRINGECRWANLYGQLNRGRQSSVPA
jgi:dTMP kinase